jgi:hypothetical protein
MERLFRHSQRKRGATDKPLLSPRRLGSTLRIIIAATCSQRMMRCRVEPSGRLSCPAFSSRVAMAKKGQKAASLWNWHSAKLDRSMQ